MSELMLYSSRVEVQVRPKLTERSEVSLLAELILNGSGLKDKRENMPRIKISWLAIGLIIGLSFAVYANTFGNRFVWDDHYLIEQNTFLHNWRHLGQIFTTDHHHFGPRSANFYRPLVTVSFMLDYHLWKLNPLGFHLSNLILHILNAILVFKIISLILKDQVTALIAGALFAIFPLHTQAVTYISGRADLIAACLQLGAFCCYLGKRYLKCLVLFGLSLLSKESAIVFPLILVLYDLSFQRNILARRQRAKFYGAIFGLSAVYIFLRINFLNFSTRALLASEHALYVRLLTFAKSFALYLGLLFWPFNLRMERSIAQPYSLLEPQILLSFLLLLAVLVALGLSYKSRRTVFFWGMWFFIFLLPYTHIVPINAVISEHWLYLSGIGFLALLSALAVKLHRKSLPIAQKALTLFLVGLLLFYAAIIVRRNQDWRDDSTIYRHTIKHSPLRPRPHFNLGFVYEQNGQIDLAIEEYQKAILLNPSYAYPRNNLGAMYLKQDKVELAYQQLTKAIELDPNLTQAHYNLALIYSQQKLYPQAKAHLSRALEINPQMQQAREGLRELELLGY